MTLLSWITDKKATPLSRTTEVGWLIKAKGGDIIFDAPRRITRNDAPPQHAKSVAFCPAMLDHEARLFEVPCPYDLAVGFRYDENNNPVFYNAAGDKSAIRSRQLGQEFHMVARKEWRHPDRPIVQMLTPYTFIADETVYITQMPAFNYYRDPPLPGTLIGGRFPLHVWPRILMWAFEWYDTSKPIILRRGEPWFYVRFETAYPDRPVRLVEARLTEELDRYMESINGVTNYVQRTFSLFPMAQKRRPKKLLVPMKR